MSYRRLLRRAFCLALALLLGVLSYRSTTAILGIAGAANNPTEGRIPTRPVELNVRENKPRPAKHKLVTRMPRVREDELASNTDPLLRRLLLAQEDAAPVASASSAAPDRRVPELTQPQYLRPFLASSPGSPQSPPV